jgi:hypothetical protein
MNFRWISVYFSNKSARLDRWRIGPAGQVLHLSPLLTREVASIHHDEQFRTGLEQLVSPLVDLAFA